MGRKASTLRPPAQGSGARKSVSGPSALPAPANSGSRRKRAASADEEDEGQPRPPRKRGQRAIVEGNTDLAPSRQRKPSRKQADLGSLLINTIPFLISHLAPDSDTQAQAKRKEEEKRAKARRKRQEEEEENDYRPLCAYFIMLGSLRLTHPILQIAPEPEEGVDDSEEEPVTDTVRASHMFSHPSHANLYRLPSSRLQVRSRKCKIESCIASEPHHARYDLITHSIVQYS